MFFSTFHIKVQLFCFPLKQYFENVTKKNYGRGVLGRVSRVTVNTTFFFFALFAYFTGVGLLILYYICI